MPSLCRCEVSTLTQGPTDTESLSSLLSHPPPHRLTLTGRTGLEPAGKPQPAPHVTRFVVRLRVSQTQHNYSDILGPSHFSPTDLEILFITKHLSNIIELSASRLRAIKSPGFSAAVGERRLLESCNKIQPT